MAARRCASASRLAAATVLLACGAALADSGPATAGANSTAPGGGEAGGEHAQSATRRLFNTLLSTFGAVIVGVASVRLGLVAPERGDLKGMGFFTGKLAFPLLIFKTVATARLGAVNLATLAACTLGKVLVLLLTWIAAFTCYEAHRSKAQRWLSATVFAFFAIASNDFAVGFPVIQALYSGTVDMGIYIAANALVGSILFVPLIMVMFAVGQNMQVSEAGGESPSHETSSRSRAAQRLAGVLLLVRDIVLNPVITMTIVGILFQVAFGFALERDGTSVKLPHPLSDFVDLVTSPFGMLALFLTGTSLRTPRLSMWAALLVAMKVVVCAFATYFFVGVLISQDIEEAMRGTLRNFGFLYGMIPTSSAPLLFASQFDPGAAELIATGIMLGLTVAGPIMFSTALFLQRASLDMSATLAEVQLIVNVSSIVCGCAFIAILMCIREKWGWDCRGKASIAAYGIVCLVYEIMMLAMNPAVHPSLCEAYVAHLWTPYSSAVSWLQNGCRLLVLFLQLTAVFPWVAEVHRVRLGLLWAAGCLTAALVPGLLVPPNTVNEMCHAVPAAEPLKLRVDSLLPNAIWTLLLLLSTTALIILAAVQQPSATVITVNSEEDSSDSSASQEEASEQTDCTAENSASLCRQANRWLCRPPTIVSRGLVGFQTLRFFVQAINTIQVIASRTVMGSFAEMLVLETMLEHGQLIVLLALVLTDDDFTKHFSKLLPRLLPFLCREGPLSASEPREGFPPSAGAGGGIAADSTVEDGDREDLAVAQPQSLAASVSFDPLVRGLSRAGSGLSRAGSGELKASGTTA